jgi:molecular chaperone Hsp33
VDGEIEVVCEFCSTAYRFNPHQFDDGNGGGPTRH